jgi:hypothetical protein
LLETEAVTFIPEIVAEAWVTLRTGSSAAGQVAQSTTDRRDHRGSQTLLDLCGVLEQLPEILKCVFGQMDENATEECTRQMQRQRQKLVDAKVSERRLRRAADLWWKIDDEDTWAPSALSSAETVNALTSAFAVVFPECVAQKYKDRWYAAGHRVRGVALKAVADEEKVFLFQARPGPWKHKNDHTMVHLKPLFCVPVVPTSLCDQENVVIICDSTLQLPGVMYGIACMLRKIGLNLLVRIEKWCRGTRIERCVERCTAFPLGSDSCQSERRLETQATRKHKRRLDSFVRVCSGSRR